MRKNTKLALVLAIVALFVIGSAMTSFAAKGWAQEDGEWYFYDSNGEREYLKWEKSGENYYYLGEDGAMVKSALVEDYNTGNYYFVDANGARVANTWAQVPADDADSELGVDYRWYYFGSNGKAYKGNEKLKIAKIGDKKYGFDNTAKMVFGYATATQMATDQAIAPTDGEAIYYFGSNEDGSMYTGWLNITDTSELGSEYNEKDSIWFYFQPSNGKKVVNKMVTPKSINGKKYYFDVNGVMLYGWKDVGASGSEFKTYLNLADQGWTNKKQWVWAEADLDYDTGAEDGTFYWYYIKNSGAVAANEVIKVNGKYYAFRDKGRMASGLVLLDGTEDSILQATKVTTKSASDFTREEVEAWENKLYYFGASSDGAMKTGTAIKIDLADDTYTFGFAKNGRAYNGFIKKYKKIYFNGILQTADDDRYKIVEVKADNNYLVGSAGSVITSGVVSDADGNYYVVSTKASEKNGKQAQMIYKFSGNYDYVAAAASTWNSGNNTFSYDGTKYCFIATEGYTQVAAPDEFKLGSTTADVNRE